MTTKIQFIASRILFISIILTSSKVVSQNVILNPAVDIKIAPLNPTATGQFVKWHEYADGIAIADKNRYNEQGLTVHNGGKTIMDFINQSTEDAARDNTYKVDLDESGRIIKVTGYRDGKPLSPYTYTYDSKGQIATKKDFFGTYTYTYDQQGRLFQEEVEGKKKTVYTYESKGKELVVTMTTTWPDKQDKTAIEVKSFENGKLNWHKDIYGNTNYSVRDARGTLIANAEKDKEPNYYMVKNVFYHDELKADLLTIKRIPGKSPQFYLNNKEYSTGFIVNGGDVIVHFPYDGSYYIKRNFIPNGLPNNQLLPLDLFRENTPVLFKWENEKIQVFHGNRALYSVYGNTDLKLFQDDNHWLYYSMDKATYYRIKKDVKPVEGAMIEPEVIKAPFILYADTAIQQWIIIAEGTQIKNTFGYEFKKADTGEVVIFQNKIPKYTYMPIDNAKPMQIITGDFYRGQSYPK